MDYIVSIEVSELLKTAERFEMPVSEKRMAQWLAENQDDLLEHSRMLFIAEVVFRLQRSFLGN